MKKQALGQMILQPLLDLGSSPKAIAASLKKKGIRGGHDQDDCPLAKELRKHYKDEIEVNNEHIKINGITIDTPKVLSSFVDRYDGGDYPELETNEARKERERREQ